MANLFKGYKCAGDKKFVDYIELKENAYHEGADIDESALMQLALNKYAEINVLDTWRAPSAEESKIIAMTAELNEIKDKNLVIVGALRKAARGDSGHSSGRGRGRGGRGGRGGSGRGRGGQRRAAYNPADSEHAWKMDRGAAGTDNPATCTKNGKTYHWCLKHRAWGIHKAEECRLDPEHEANVAETDDDTQEPGGRTTERNQAFLAALRAIGEDEDTDVDE